MEANTTFVDPQSGRFSDSEVGSMLGTSFNVNAMRPYWHKGRVYINQKTADGKMVAMPVTANAALLRDEWIEIDKVVQKVARERLVGAADLLGRGLTYNLTNPMGKTVFEYQDMDDPGEAAMSMDGATQGKGDRPDFQTKYLPIPIIHSDFTIGQRALEASRNSGDALDTTIVEAHTRRVTEKLEDLLFTDTTYAFGGGTIYSYLSFTSKNEVTLSANWDASGKTGAQILTDVLNMIEASITAKHYGPWVLYIPTAYQTKMSEDYATGYPKSIMQRLMEIEGLTAIKVADRLTANKVILAQMTSDTVRLINGFSPKVIQWSSQGGMIHHFKVMAIQVPQMRAAQAGNSGITVLSA